MTASARRRAAWSAVAVEVILLAVMGATCWHLASQQVRGTEGLIAQAQLLLAFISAVLATAVADATVFYAVKTSDMVEAMRGSNDYDRVRAQQTAVVSLLAAANAVAGHSAALDRAQRRPLRYLPSRTRVQLAIAAHDRVSAAIAEAVQHVEAVRVAAPEIVIDAEQLLFAALDVQQAGSNGAGPRAFQRRVEALRDAAGTVRRHALETSATDGHSWGRSQ